MTRASYDVRFNSVFWDERAFQRGIRRTGAKRMRGALAVSLHFFMPKDYPSMDIFWVFRHAEWVTNALTGLCFANPTQITSLVITKEFGEPRVVIGITEWRKNL